MSRRNQSENVLERMRESQGFNGFDFYPMDFFYL